ncbi:hypothetical protein F2P81_005481 [Scophthalmus maximus]|uniref:Axonemal dynein light chain domain-containing protein 1 n=1 Tax=Scophthalmus maximus TaxID=52904 RepID=A0A6A4TAN7_SCOMX|nr:hypothetical protein F2P81_005481 [Scophthalmus maximus]
MIPDELLASLTSTVGTPGHTAHHRHCRGCGIRRPDAVWHHPLGRKKYKHFLEQPTSLNGAGSDISFLCDAMVNQRKITPLPPLTDRNGIVDTQSLSMSESLIPEEYRIVKNNGLRGLEIYEDAFTVKLQDDKHTLRLFPSLGRLEVIQLLRMMDDMLEKAGVDHQSEELTQLSQIEGLLELVQVEQNIYNVVFHEVIRQVSVGCAERGQLLAKLRQRYQSLLERIPRRLKALHTEAVAQRALDRRLTDEIRHIRTSIQRLSTYVHVVQGYHELYELQRGRLEAQLLQMTEERDCWSQLTFCFALKYRQYDLIFDPDKYSQLFCDGQVISVKKLQLVSQLHVHEQSWSKTAEHCILYLTSKDTEHLNIIMELTDHWEDQLTAFMSHMKKTEHAQFEEMNGLQLGITKWIAFCDAQNKSPYPKYENVTLEKIHADLKQWSNMLARQCERYQGEELFCRQQTLVELGRVQERWLNMSLQLFRRHSSPEGEPPANEPVLRELVKLLPELLKQLDTQATGETGVHGKIASLLGFMESWVAKLDAVICQPETMPVSDWLKLEQALCNWQSLAEEALQNVSTAQTEEGKGNERDKDESNIYLETKKLLNKVKGFIISLSTFTDGENQRLIEEVSSIHMTQTRWMLDLLLLMVPDHSEDQDSHQEHQYIKHVSPQALDERANIVAEKLDDFSRYITSFNKLILEEQILPHQAEGENEMNECRKLQRECVDWVETCKILLSAVKAGAVELPVRQPATSSRSDIVASPADSVGISTSLRVFDSDSELRVQSAEQRALKAQEALQAALEKIQDLERQLLGRPSLEPG